MVGESLTTTALGGGVGDERAPLTEERSVVDVAAELGVTPAAVRKAKSRVLHRLKVEFADLIQ